MWYKVGKLVRWGCATYFGGFLLLLILLSTKVISLDYGVVQKLYYISFAFWLVAILTKLIPKKEK